MVSFEGGAFRKKGVIWVIFVMNGMLTVVVIWLLVSYYKTREEPETYLGWKLVGYYLVGAFTFRFNDFPFPLGYILFLLFFRPTTNVKAKQRAAFLGLAIFFAQLIIPALDEYLYERPREVAGSSVNIYEVNFTHDWSTIREKMSIDPDAHLENFRAEYQKDGQIKRLSYDLVTRSEEGFIRYDIDYSSETKEYTIKRRKVGKQWLQYNRTVLASRFFAVLDQVQVRNLSPEHSYERIILTSDGEMASYAIKDRKKYLIRGNVMDEITDDELPVKGYYVTACGMNETYKTTTGSTRSYGCEGEVDYFFDVTQRK
jgi:hypothetical protein